MVFLSLTMPVIFLSFDIGTVEGDVFTEKGIWGDDGEAPEILEVNLTSDLPDHPTGGYLGTEFSLLVEYLDPDDDPPATILITFDPGTVYEFSENITSMELNPLDSDHTNGKLYLYEFQGWEVGEDPYPHDILVTASDDPPGNSSSSDSKPYFLNDTLFIWDDDPVRIDPAWYGLDPIPEDSGSNLIPLEGGGRPFIDPEHSLVGASVSIADENNWTDSLELELATVKIDEGDDGFYLNITPKQDRYGDIEVDVKVHDEHTSAVRSFPIIIFDVQDLPYFDLLVTGEGNYTPEQVTERMYVIHLEGVQVIEDREFRFTIHAWIDGIHGSGPVFHERSLSDEWKHPPEKGDQGGFSFVPDNEDVVSGSELMVFSIIGSNPKVLLHLHLDIVNMNDPPVLYLPSTLPRRYEQFDQLLLDPIAKDPDPHENLTFTCNVVHELGSNYTSLNHQLPFARLNRSSWDFNTSTGELWIAFDDQGIWMTNNGSVDDVEITIAIRVTDGSGANATSEIIIVLSDINEPPIMDGYLYYEPYRPETGQPVVFWVNEASDPDMDHLTYRWDLGDGTMATGRVVDHTYSTKGWKTVQVWVDDGKATSERYSLRIEVLDGGGSIWMDQDSDGDGVENRYDSFPDDIAASVDTDGDDHPDLWNPGFDKRDSTTGLVLDSFPLDPGEWKDTDGDGHGDNSDRFPLDPSEWKDTDGDGIGDGSDRFPTINNDLLRTILFIVMISVIAGIALLGIILWTTSRMELEAEVEE